MKESKNDQLVAYLLGDLSEAEKQELDRQFQQSPTLRQELEELKLVLGLMDQQVDIEPSPYSRDQFYQFLELEVRPQNKPVNQKVAPFNWWAAAAAALLLIGVGFGVLLQNHSRQQLEIQRLSAEVVETRKLMLLAMLDDASASERIKAMNVSTRDFQTDQQVVEALINRLQKDENDNVRLKAAESLSEFMSVEGVTGAVIQALELESSPEVQIMLIEALVNGQRKEAAPSLRKLMDRNDVPEVVRDLAAYGLETMI